MLCVVSLQCDSASSDYLVTDFLNSCGFEHCKVKRARDVPASATKVIISGGPLHSSKALELSQGVLELNIPVLGICAGCMAIVLMLDGGLLPREREVAKTVTHSHWIFDSCPDTLRVDAQHREQITHTGQMNVIAKSTDGEIVGVKWWLRPVFGVMFHPESSIVSSDAAPIISNFINKV